MNILKFFKWSAVHLAWITMSWAPVTMGAEAEQLSKQKLAQYIQEFGLQKKTTLGEFWEKSKAYYPGYIYKEIEAFVQQNRNLEMPEVVVSSAKATDGSEIPTIQFSQNGRIHSAQIFGTKQKWAKFNNTLLTMLDMQRPQDIFSRLQANDIRVKKEAEVLQKKSEVTNATYLKNQSEQQKDFARFHGFPRMTPKLWKSMTPVQRASFFVNMRLMWRDAQKVLDTSSISDFRKDKRSSTVEYFYKAIFDDAYAEGSTGVLPEPPRKHSSAANAVTQNNAGSVGSNTMGKVRPRVFDAGSCIVAGYVGVYDQIDNNRGKQRQGCSVEKAIDGYKKRESSGTGIKGTIEQANNQCVSIKSTSIACNPLVYGYPNGKPACVNKEDSSFQTATHYQGICDAQSPLISAKEPLFKDKDYSNIVPREKQIAMIEADQEKQKNELTKQFLQGILKAKDDKSLFNAFQKGEWTKELDNELIRIQSSFEEEINGAIKTCEMDIKHKNEVNQKGACDQLHRRWLFTEKFLLPLRAKACAPGTKYIGSDKKLDDLDKNPLLCECEFDAATKIALGKEGEGQCPTQSAETSPAAAIVDKSCPAGTSFVQSSDENKCKCIKKDMTVPQSTPAGEVAELCKEKSNLWKWLLGGLGVLALVALFNRHKKSQAASASLPPLCDANKKLDGGACVCSSQCAADKSQNPQTCACDALPAQLCSAPFVGMPPSCVCPMSNSCTPGQQIFNQVTCQCTNVAQPVICPNGSPAPGNNLTQCLKCLNGSYAPIGGCPSSNEGGSGNNCPQGNCNGGVPTAH